MSPVKTGIRSVCQELLYRSMGADRFDGDV